MLNMGLRSILHKCHVASLYAAGGRRALKEYYELKAWTKRAAREGRLSSGFFKEWYTSYFGLHETFYTGKKILDVGCGPRGSLEWAQMASERVGLDPMAAKYRKLGTAAHQMDYILGCAEAIPVVDNYFDVVSSFDSLKHVDDLDLAVKEIIRVLSPGGTFLLHTVVGAGPTRREPTVITWELAQKFTPELAIVDEDHYERFFGYRDSPEEFVPRMLRRAPYDHANQSPRLGVLSAKFTKVLSG